MCQDATTCKYTCALVSHETFITHNGDLDFYEWHGVNYPLDDVFVILEKLLQCKPPAFVDSMGVAGLLDLLRTKGLWFQSVRYAYIKGGLANVGNLTTDKNLSQFWTLSTLNAIVGEFETRWKEISGKKPEEARQEMLKTMLAAAQNIDFKLPPTAGKIGDVEGGNGNSGPELLVKAAVDAFFDQDLYAAGKEFLAHAEGSFGLCLSSSVDATNEVVLGARGQTMSIAFWPKLGVLTWGSEAAATKTGLGQETGANRTGAAETDLMDGFRFDLDEVNGEIVRLCWDAEASAPTKYPAIEAESDDPTPPNTSVMKYGEGVTGAVRITHCIEGHHGSTQPFMKRVLRMGGNPYVDPLPDLSIKDKVGADIADIPKICKKIIDDWDEPSESLNRFSAFTLLTKLRKRLVMHQTGTHDGAVDLLITGMEVSLWCGEQFASDLHNAFPKLKIVTISSNKLLAQLGQNFPIPNTGFYFNENSNRFTNDTCAMLISHSGGTFGTLNVSNLLKGYTSNLFVVTSEWDTQVAKSVRAGKPGKIGNRFSLNSYVFTTFCGIRPAEPVSLTAVATQQLLTQILLYLMYAARYYYPQYPMLGGSDFTIQDVQELTALNRDNIKDLEEMISNKGSVVRRELLAQGKAWSKHILEGPTTWIMSAIYILATVTAGYTPLSAIVTKVFTDPGLPLGPGEAEAFPGGPEISFGELKPGGYALKYIVGVLDSLIYIFLPIWTAFLLRFIQGRPMLHRVAGRSLLIGDVPWVAQTLEAFVSKCFALAYSAATIGVASSNPIDHLVHRHTHRVVRGSLLAVGRPDGRLNALTAAENAACLATNQASSIQNWGVTCESFTLGHNPFKLPLTKSAIHLPTTRKDFFSEHALKMHVAKSGKSADGMSASALMGTLSTLDMDVFEKVKQRPAAERPEFIKKMEPMWGEGAFSDEHFVGEWMASDEKLKGLNAADLMEKQSQLQELYEGRIASMQRLVGFLVLFHEMGRRVQDFWPMVSFGIFGYDMSRSHSIMRIATTASPISGSDVRHKMIELAEQTAKQFAASILAKWFIRSRLGGNRKGGGEMNDAEITSKIEALLEMKRKRK